MKKVGVIPARWHSTRFEGKPLADIAGKPMIQHVWEQSNKAKELEEIYIATDDERILNAAKSFGALAIQTRPDHATGTDRIIEAAENIEADIIVNIQGDEPLIDPGLIDQVALACANAQDCSMATAVKLIDDEEELNNPNVVKAVFNHDGYAMYFSRSAIPFQRTSEKVNCYKHIGLYAYTKDFLKTYKDLPESSLEKAEQLEQLRVISAGYKIKIAVTDKDSIGVDTPEDLEKVKELLINQ